MAHQQCENGVIRYSDTKYTPRFSLSFCRIFSHKFFVIERAYIFWAHQINPSQYQVARSSTSIAEYKIGCSELDSFGGILR